ncbi:MAG: VWA domain-containing protein [Gammaproteobacteria bacterium]|nr:VWA domain-containing protein [Gammaproteobacteria bacterium]NKC11680.1 VWA domain-containing protein [Gammaproteobacteria bacterium]
MPGPSAVLHRFVVTLRQHGFVIAPEQAIGFLAAIKLLGPRDVEQIRWSGHAMLAPPAERLAEFNRLFDAFFLDAQAGALTTLESAEEQRENARVFDVDRGEPSAATAALEASGQAAARTERAGVRRFAGDTEERQLRELRKRLPTALPRRRGMRLRPARHGTTVDMRRTLGRAIRHDGELLQVLRRGRHPVPRKVLLLIDVSGSMKIHTEALMRTAHSVVHSAPRAEVFTFGTRLSRVTRALRHRHLEQALAAVAASVADWDGGTRIGEAFQAFFAVPKFTAHASGAVCVIISDGLERGDPALLARYLARLARLAWRSAWLTPLAADPAFTPDTLALQAVLPLIDDLADGSGAGPVSRYLLNIAGRNTARRNTAGRNIAGR